MHANVVIVGAGIVGASVAYHLAKLGWEDIVLLDQGDLFKNPGSTSHAPGGVGALSHSKLLTQMANYGSDLYRNLPEFDTQGEYPGHLGARRRGYHGVGSIDIATSERRWQDLKRLAGEARSYHTEAHLLSPRDAAGLVPFLNPDALIGGIFVKNSALVAGSWIVASMRREAARMSAGRYSEHGNCAVTDVETRDGRVIAVKTSSTDPALARIETAHVVLATNIWGPLLGDKLGVPLPLMPYEHQYVITEPLEPLAKYDPANVDEETRFPMIRDLDHTLYMRQHWNSYGLGNYWHRPLRVRPEHLGPDALREFSEPELHKAWAQFNDLMPMTRGAKRVKAYHGIFAFPVDGMMCIGEGNLRGLWTACGSWLTHAGGVGKSLAEWMTNGEPEWDMRQVNVNRFHRFQSSRAYTHAVCDNNYVEVYEIIHPRQPPTKGRNVRFSPLHARWQAQGASFTQAAGIELPNWCEENVRLLEKYEAQIPMRSGWGAQFWSPIQGAEHLATRENVGLFDLSGLSIFEARGPDALGFAQYICSNDVDKAIGRLVYTCWLTPLGGVRRDLAVCRVGPDTYWFYVGEGTRPQDWVWFTRAAEAFAKLQLTDVSDAYGCIGLWGPNARRVLESVTLNDVSNAAFPYFTAQTIEIGSTPIHAIRVSYAGELGWELHMPIDQAIGVWDALWAAGQPHGVVAAGAGAFDSLRLEKGYRGWGNDVHTEYSPYEAGLGWTVKLDKPMDYIGKAASVATKASPLTRKLCCITLDDRDAVLIGAEPIFSADGDASANAIGHVTSANFGYSVGKFIAFGYLPMPSSALGTRLEVQYFGKRFAATVADDPLFDAKMARMKV